MIAFVRDVSSQLNQCELTHVPRAPIDANRVRAQHSAFVAALEALGATVRFMAALPDQPDGVFVEDAAVILSETVVIARPGAISRRPEIETVAATLAEYRPIVRISGAATLEGGDVLRIGRTLFVGQSIRTNADGIAALAETVGPFGYDVQPVEVRDCLHLKTACTFIPPHFLVANPTWVDLKPFGGLNVIEVDPSEPFAANTVTLAGTTLVSGAFRRTERRLHDAGISTRRLDVSEFHKAEAGLSCLCLLLEPRAVARRN
jgi:dimethylargininase